MNRRQALIGGALATGGLAAMAVRPAVTKRADLAFDLDETIPKRIAGWQATDPRGVVLPPEDALSEQIYDSYLVRGYQRDDGPQLFVVIAYGAAQSYGLQLHRPEICYPASGYSISNTAPATLELENRIVAATSLTANRQRRVDQVLYWTRIGTGFPRGLWEQRRLIALGAVRGRLPDGALTRLSASTYGDPVPAGYLAGFAAAFASALPPHTADALLGRVR